MNSLIKSFLREIQYGNDNPIPPNNADKIFSQNHLVYHISEYLDDQDLLKFIQVNKQIYKLSQDYSEFKIRILEIRLKRSTKILDEYIESPAYLKQNHPLHFMLYQYQYTDPKGLKIQDFFLSKKKLKKERIEPIKVVEKQQPKIQKDEIDKIMQEFEIILSEEIPTPKVDIKKVTRTITSNLCPVVQYKRVKDMAIKVRAALEPQIKTL